MHACTKMHTQHRHAYFMNRDVKTRSRAYAEGSPSTKYVCVCMCLPAYPHACILSHIGTHGIFLARTGTHALFLTQPHAHDSHTHTHQEMRYVKIQVHISQSILYVDASKYAKALTSQNFRQEQGRTHQTLCSPRTYQTCSGLSISARAHTNKHANTHTSTKGGAGGGRGG